MSASRAPLSNTRSKDWSAYASMAVMSPTCHNMCERCKFFLHISSITTSEKSCQENYSMLPCSKMYGMELPNLLCSEIRHRIAEQKTQSCRTLCSGFLLP